MWRFKFVLSGIFLLTSLMGWAQYDLKKTEKAFYLLNRNKILTEQSATNYYARRYKLFPIIARQNIQSAAEDMMKNLDSIKLLLPPEKSLLNEFEKLKNLAEMYVTRLSEVNSKSKDLQKSKNRVLKKTDGLLETLLMYTGFDSGYLGQLQKLVGVNQNLQTAMQAYILQYNEGNVHPKDIISLLKDAGNDMKSIRDYYAKDKNLSQILRHIHQDIQLFHQGIKNGYAPKIMVASLNKTNRKILETYSILSQKQKP